MNVIIIKRKWIYTAFTLLLLLIMGGYFLLKTKEEIIIPTFHPIDNSKEIIMDLNKDGEDEKLRVLYNDRMDVQITVGSKNVLLSNLCKDNTLIDNLTYWPLKLYILDASRSPSKEILIQGSKDGKPISYLFGWIDKELTLLNASTKNIVGVLDSNLNRTPQYQLIQSSLGLSSLECYMYQGNQILNLSGKSKPIKDINCILEFINIIEVPYNINDLPDIFSRGIPKEELGLLWKLDKEISRYSFQNGFFFDDKLDDIGNIYSTKWRLYFEKYTPIKDDEKNSISITLQLEKCSDGTFKITSFYKE